MEKIIVLVVLILLSGCSSAQNQRKATYLYGLVQLEYYNSDNPHDKGDKY